jgi:putative ATPase
MKEGYGEEYKYAHDYNNNFADQEFLQEALKETPIYIPGNNSRENSIREFFKEQMEDKYGY